MITAVDIDSAGGLSSGCYLALITPTISRERMQPQGYLLASSCTHHKWNKQIVSRLSKKLIKKAVAVQFSVN